METEGVRCPRCGFGQDTDGDGHCAWCYDRSDEDARSMLEFSKTDGYAVPNPAQPPMRVKSGVELIAEERARQVMQENWTPEHDDGHTLAQLTLAGFSYASLAASQVRLGEGCVNEVLPQYWPWEPKWWKPSPDPARNLVKAAALLAAEIDRLKRKGIV